jgi:S-(hydroxymethyl)glutathione dehydrogenase/alcohol dehydrogenase
VHSRAAILWETGQPWSVEDVDLDPPKEQEVLVRMVASGLCHSDDHGRTGDMPMVLPVVGGHEGSGVVEEVGPGVTTLHPGDHVVTSYIPSCGRCPACSTGHQNLCDLGRFLMTGKMIVDGGRRVHARGTEVSTVSLLGTFAEHAVVHEASLVKIDDDIPLDLAALVGCGVTTGWGSAVYVGKVRPGEVVVVVGVGGLGIAAVQGARLAGADQIIAVDPVAFKRETALKLGATDTAESMEQAKELVVERTRGRLADVAILTVGVAHGDMIAPFLALVAKNGRAVVTAITPHTERTVEIPLMEFTLWQKQLLGNTFGAANPRADIPMLLRLWQHGHLDLESMVTTRYPLTEVNTGYADLLSGRNIRGLLVHGS